MNEKALDPSRIILILEILLAQLGASLSSELSEDDSRTDYLKNRISGFKDQTARLKSVLRKHQDAERRRKQIGRENKRNR